MHGFVKKRNGTDKSHVLQSEQTKDVFVISFSERQLHLRPCSGFENTKERNKHFSYDRHNNHLRLRLGNAHGHA